MMVSEREEQLESERAAKAKVEKQRVELQRELDDLNDRLEETGGNVQAQVDYRTCIMTR